MDRLILGLTQPIPAPSVPAADADVLPASPAAAPEPVRLAEAWALFSHALDLGEGRVPGHGQRCAWIGLHIARALGLDAAQQADLYPTLLLQDLGGSATASRLGALYQADDRAVRHDLALAADSFRQRLGVAWRHAGRSGPGGARRWPTLLGVLVSGPAIHRELLRTRRARGAELARQLGLSERVVEGIACVDEHWNGHGQPKGLAGEVIPLAARIALLAQTVAVQLAAHGPQAAVARARRMAGRWLDPQLVQVLDQVAAAPGFREGLQQRDLDARVLALAPPVLAQPLDDERLDALVLAFAQVIDAKSPYTIGHAARMVARCDALAQRLSLPPNRRRLLRRAAALHDLGKLGVSNAVLDKPTRLEAEAWVQVRSHARHTEAVISRIGALAGVAHLAGGHHERLDGGGYPRNLKAEGIPLETRILTVVDVFDALCSDRAYRHSLPPAQALRVMRGMVNTVLDPLVYGVLCELVTVPPAAAPAAGSAGMAASL